MKNKLMQSVPLVIALVGVGFAHFSYWCMYSYGVCYSNWVSHIYQYFTNPFYNFSLYLLPLTIILVLISRPIFNSWLKLAVWAVPLSIIFIASNPVTSGGFMDLYPFYRDDAARLAAQVLTVVSFLLIGWKYLKSRNGNLRTS
ncbi:MAG: hypothetical protein AAB442_02605 [Patescibacteria group bacterium]